MNLENQEIKSKLLGLYEGDNPERITTIRWTERDMPSSIMHEGKEYFFTGTGHSIQGQPTIYSFRSKS